MSGFKVNFSVNNQLSTPSIHAAPFAQRPAAGQPGRVFIDSNNPSTGIYRDTGITWVPIGNPSTPDVDTLQIVTDRGNTTTQNITVGAASSPVGTVDVRRSTAALNGANDWAFLGVNTPTIPSGASFGVNYVNAVYGSQAQTFAGNATIGNAGLNSAGNFINTLGNSASGTITVAQGSGTIRAIAGLHAGIYYNTPNAMTFTHVAGIRTLQPINSGAVGASVTNYYGIHVADSTPATGTISYTNRFGIYQEGASDVNYFAANVGIGTTSPTVKLEINGGMRLYTTGGFSVFAIGATNVGGDVLELSGDTRGSIVNSKNNYNLRFQTNGTDKATIFNNTGNLLIQNGGSHVDAGYKLDIANGALRVLDGGTNAIRLQQSATGNMGISWRLGNSEYANISNDTSAGLMSISSSYSIYISSNGNPNIFVRNNGWVGIGKNRAFLSCDFVGSIGNSDTLRQFVIGAGTSAAAPTYSFYGDGTTGQYMPAFGSLGWSISGSDAMRLNSTGLGIGTTSPAARLHVNGTFRIDGQSSGTAGGSSGQHLIINLDGTTYKIALLNP